MITITLITKNWLKTLDLRYMMGYNKKSSKEPKKNLKRNGAPFTPESSHVMEFLNAHYKICFNNNKVSG